MHRNSSLEALVCPKHLQRQHDPVTAAPKTELCTIHETAAGEATKSPTQVRTLARTDTSTTTNAINYNTYQPALASK